MMTIRTSSSAPGTTTRAAAPGDTLRVCLVMAGLFCFTVIQLLSTVHDTTTTTTGSRSMLSMDCDYFNSPAGCNHRGEQQQQQPPQQSQEEGDDDNVTLPMKMILESFAISFDPDKVEKLKERNWHANLGNDTLWVNGADGLHQRTLDLWAKLTGGSVPMSVQEASRLNKDDYRSPHAVGVYLAHWNLLRTLAHRHSPSSSLPLVPSETQKQQQQQQHAYLILEDDAMCAPGLKEEIARVIQQLPSDWDLLFVGGKPFSYFDLHSSDPHENNDDALNKTTSLTAPRNTTFGKQLIHEYYAKNQDYSVYQQIRHAVCQGHFGKARGPLAPDGSRRLSPDQQAYWRADYLTNTQSYVVNPKRIKHVARLLNPQVNVPVDVRFGDLMVMGKLNGYMTTRVWCDQGTSPDQRLLEPHPWQGYFAFQPYENRYDWRYIWQNPMQMDDHADCAF